MRESKMKRPGLVARAENLNPESKENLYQIESQDYLSDVCKRLLIQIYILSADTMNQENCPLQGVSKVRSDFLFA